MEEYFQQIHSFLDSDDSSESRVDDILHHDLQVFQSSTELDVVVMPVGGLHVKDRLTNTLQTSQVFLKGVLNLFDAASDFWTSAATKTRYRPLVPF